LVMWPSPLLSRLPKPEIPGPRGWRTTPLLLTGLSCPPFKLVDPRVDGKLGTGGTLNALPLEKREPKPADTRREEEMVA
jgi:hypothetical protein